MKKTTKYALASMLTLGAMALVVAPALASSLPAGTPTLGDFESEFGGNNLNQIIQGIIQVILAFLGVIAVLIILWGGFIWMTAAGEPDKVQKAKSMIYSGIIGLVIIFAAYAIATFVISALENATGGNPISGATTQ